jgi:hypothetical protein
MKRAAAEQGDEAAPVGLMQPGSSMKRALAVTAWIFLALDAAAVLFFLVWTLMASEREGEKAYATVFLLGAAVILAIGAGVLRLAAKRGSALGVGCAATFLAIPSLVALVLWISDMFGL